MIEITLKTLSDGLDLHVVIKPALNFFESANKKVFFHVRKKWLIGLAFVY